MYKICKHCKCEITPEKQAIQHKRWGNYVRNECKRCRVKMNVAWKQKKPEEKLDPCGICGTLCVKKYDRIFCSAKCRLMGYVLKRDDCWLWTGHIVADGYGKIMIDGKKKKVHRASYELFKGPIPKGMIVRHMCNEPLCINPDHLLLGTFQENADDMVKAGRSSHGENHPKAKLTDDSVREIRRSYAAKEYSQQELANKYGVNQMNISFIVRRSSWKHVL